MYKRKEIIGDATLYLGDSIEIMKDLDAVDCIVTDPPYRLTSGGKGGNPKKDGVKRMSGCFTASEYENKGDIVECNIDWIDFMPLLFKVLNHGHAYVMCNNRHIANCENASLSAGFKLHNWLVWNKMTCTPNRWYMKNCEFTGFFYKGRAKFINDCGHKQLLSCPQEDYGNHPTTKPIALMQHYIENSTKKADTVLDPFMGVGSTGVAAINSGRKFIGIEIDENYFNLAHERICNMEGQKRLF